MNRQKVKVGFLAPLSAPGWLDAGSLLLSGFQAGINEINSQEYEYSDSLKIEPLIRDTAGNPDLASEMVRSLNREGVQVIAGEYHSVVARSISQVAHELELPYLCSSAVLDKLIDTPSDWVARLPPPQSIGWARYADYLCSLGHTQVATLYSDSLYWRQGMKILQARLAQHGGNLTAFEYSDPAFEELQRFLLEGRASSVLLLLGHPSPIVSVLRSLRSESSLRHILIGTPAGQAELKFWHDELGTLGSSVPFLQYLPHSLTPLGQSTTEKMNLEGCTNPSFVYLEGYDSALVVADLLSRPLDPRPWASVSVEGTRGSISFAFDPICNAWQWQNAPVRVAELTGSLGNQEVRPLTKSFEPSS